MSPPANTFAVPCACGAVVPGERTTKAQTVPCPACGQPLFVFPVPPLPPELTGAAIAGEAVGPVAPAPPLRFWLAPVLAALTALVVVAVVVAALVRSHRPNADVSEGPDGARTAAEAAQRIDSLTDAVRAALADGSYRLAARDLETAQRLHARFPEVLPAARRDQFRGWHRQATLLADLLAESPGEIMQHALGMDEREWQAAFRDRYAGRSFVLDARVWRDGAGRHQIDFDLEAGGLTGEWDLQGFKLLERLPLVQPQRLLFGARLAEVARAGRDRWRLRPEPGSGVLLTDPLLVSGLSLPLDDELRAVLRRQAGWAADLNGPAEGW